MSSFIDMMRMYKGGSYDEVFFKFLESLESKYAEKLKDIDRSLAKLEDEWFDYQCALAEAE